MNVWRRWFGTSAARIDELVDRVAHLATAAVRDAALAGADVATPAERIGYLQAKARRPTTAALAVVLAGEAPITAEAEAEVLLRARRAVAETVAAEWQGAARTSLRRAA
jgi:hypothetical protein